MRLVSVHFVSIFLLTRLMRGATTKYHKLAVAPVISTHAPHARRDYIPDHFGRTRRDFYSRASCERDWHHPQIESIHFQFLLPRLLRGATKKRSFVSHTFRISTPTPLARRDQKAVVCFAHLQNFYSHASCEARRMAILHQPKPENFYSRASCEARRILSPPRYSGRYFYSRASCEARLGMNTPISRV